MDGALPDRSGGLKNKLLTLRKASLGGQLCLSRVAVVPSSFHFQIMDKKMLHY